MKKLLLIALVFTFALPIDAQIKTPQPSPFSKLEQKVGLTDVALQYSRPGMRGRAIFGNLVPFGKLWRTGANKNTIVSFSDDVVIDGQTLKAGEYAIFTTPNKESWEVVFYSDTENWGTPQKWDDSKVAAKTTVKVYDLPMDIETFTITIDDLNNNEATIGIMWEKAYVGIKFSVPTDKTVTTAIDKAMKGPDANDYYAAAVYYAQNGKDIKQAKTWIDKAMSMVKKPRFWQLRQQSLIYAKSGDKKGAISAAKKSLKGAEKAGNDDYVKLNKDSLKEWGAK